MAVTAQRSSEASGYDDEGRYLAQTTALFVGAVFVIVGTLGFIPGVTQHIAFKAGERFSGPQSHAMLLGVFQTSVLANLIFLAVGVIGAVCSFFNLTARLFYFGTAVVFAFFFVYGLSINRSGSANFLPMNTASTWLHLGIAVVMLVVGVLVTRRR